MEDKHLKVLLIEDNPGDANLIRQMLTEERLTSFDLEWAEELSTGLKHLARRDIDALLLDLSLPDSQGLDTFTRVQTQAPELPIIVLSGLEDETLAVEAVRKGAQDYLVKGQVDSHLLSRAIKYAVQRKQVEEALRKEKDRAQKYLDVAGVIFIVIDAQGKVSLINKKGCEILGYREREIIGKIWFDNFIPEKVRNEAKAVFRKLILGEIEPVEYNEKLVLTKSGEERIIAWHDAVLRDEKGNVYAILSSGEDITRRKLAEETLLRSEKLKALGEMAAGVAHDFNNLLAIILGNAQLLEKGVERYKSEEIKERLRIIARTAYEGGETVRRLQYFTSNKLLTQDFTMIDLNEIVRSAIISTSPRWKDEAEAKGVTIRIKEELGKLPLLLGNRSELMEVSTNLIFNALEAMPGGGEITIKTGAREDEVLLYFTDSGRGIPDRIKERIFEPFFTTKGPHASGLGLSVSYGIIKRHQGKVKVESMKGKGTTFTISIPVRLGAALEKEKLRATKKISSGKILVIDDEEGIREVLREIFQDEGHRVVLAGTAREGLEKLKQDNSNLTLTGLEDNFDLVLTDLGMPKMSGWQLAKKIKEIDPGLPVGLITGWTVATPKKKMKEEGVDFILSKPFDYAKVLREVNAFLKSKKR